MNKLLVLIILGIFLINGIGAAAFQEINTDNEINYSIQTKLNRSNLLVQHSKNNQLLSIRLDETNTYLSEPGKPLLPKIVRTFELPFGATNIDISVTPNKKSSQHIDNYVEPASMMLPLTLSTGVEKIPLKRMDMTVYTQDMPYPQDLYKTRVGCGLNNDNDHVTFVTIEWYPVQYNPLKGELTTYDNVNIDISFQPNEKTFFAGTDTFDLLIIAPSEFNDALQPLVDHKNDLNPPMKTTLKNTEVIYDNPKYSDCIDEAEQIKYFIKDAIENWDISYVLLVGGLKSMVYAKPRDNCNLGISGWYLPVRYTNMIDNPAFPLAASSLHDPGVISDLYYADIYKEGGEFEDWNPNGDEYFLALGKEGVDDDIIDFYPDVALSRLPCRNIEEVNTVVNKIITYERNPIDESWFEKMIVVSGDGFLDQEDLNIQWDTSEVTDGNYTIYAQSKNPENEYGPIISINVTKDRSAESVITYSHDDHLNPAIIDAFENGFPTVPIAEIVSVSEGDILGDKDSDVAFDPPSNDYCNEFFYWANVSYVDEVLTIRGKSYDPKPYGNLSSIHIWIENDNGEKVFEDWRNDTEIYYEGEWTTGEKELLGRGGALSYMPQEFEREILWTSNGKLTNPNDVISSINQGAGFLFFSGHGSPNVWADQLPGIPGDRGPASVTGLEVTKLSLWGVLGVLSFKRSFQSLLPFFPMDSLSNGEKLPIAVVGGCHNSQFNVSMILGVKEGLEIIFDFLGHSYMWCHGYAVPETFSWRLIRNPNGGAIASMGNTGLGYGMPGKELTTGGGDSWITIEFFRQYGEKNIDILGDTYMQTLNSYIDTFDMTDLSAGHPKTITQWILFGDPTLKIGGYE